MVQLLESTSMLMTLEPEAAALAAVMVKEAMPGTALREVAKGSLTGSMSASASCSLSSSDVVLVLDCGGGTADVTLHRVRGSGVNARLDEAAVGKGVW